MLTKPKRQSKSRGLPPGALVLIGDEHEGPAIITLIEYNAEAVREEKKIQLAEALESRNNSSISWVNIDGLQDISAVQKAGQVLDLHPLVMEDILNTEQRPKVEFHESYIFLSFKMLVYDELKAQVRAEQVSLILGSNYVVSFQEVPGDLFEPVRERLRKYIGKIRERGADYLAYSLMDVVVDHYFSIVEHLGDYIEKLEDVMLAEPEEEQLSKVHRLKKDVLYLKRTIQPFKDAVDKLYADQSDLVRDLTRRFLTDIQDHLHQVLDTLDSYKDVDSSLKDIYLSALSVKMNNVMKVLTIMASIFIPLTFLAGVYGMNFKYIPELDWKYSYPVFWVVNIAVVVGMLIYFKRKDWL